MIHAHTITLTPSEIHLAVSVGALRYVENLRTRRYQGHGLDGDPLQIHILGACGEAAFAKARGVYWNGDIGDLKAPDVGGWQVRTTRRLDGRLIIRTIDEDDAPFVLVRGQCPTFAIVGWILARLAKCPEWLESNGRPAAYFVPAYALRPFALYSEHEPPPSLFEEDPRP
jgi:hypothetical protein